MVQFILSYDEKELEVLRESQFLRQDGMVRFISKDLNDSVVNNSNKISRMSQFRCGGSIRLGGTIFKNNGNDYLAPFLISAIFSSIHSLI